MNFFNNLKIGARLGAAFATTLVLMLFICAIGVSGLRSANEHMSHIVNDNLKNLNLAKIMSEQVHIVSRVVRTHVLLDEPAQQETEAIK